ncbi:TonB-linked outer membrane protein, SusC/RagA family [Cnuella takakiae]|uniref:TonB-linked outer membrane protein, SusC/RagA family n=2 Tax=Cnuella takakiae TaxID=1302690 RepID=A0A1M4Z1A4_9BACT|nr:TonB-linked outer membrane protein, SusC/RagA family [Cnuella takakiae]
MYKVDARRLRLLQSGLLFTMLSASLFPPAAKAASTLTDNGAPISKNFMADVRISGTVRDRLGAPLPDVTVQVVGNTALITRSDSAGKFAITIPENASLIFTAVGYKPQTIGVNALNLDVVMDAAEGNMQEVVVVGFGKAKKISIVGAQSSVSIDELKQPVANLSATLAGRIAGVVGVQRSGLPGENAADLWIRGISTFGNNPSGPLIVIDGVQNRGLNAFDPEDIASFTILKDANALAVYGVAGANGVILITTKRGRLGKPSILLNYNQGITAFTKLPELTDGPTYMNLRNEAQVASGLAPEYSQAAIDATTKGDQPYLYPNVNWMKAIFNDYGVNRRANFSVRGGSEAARYYVSFAYYDETSLLKTDGLQSYDSDTRFRRLNVTTNLDMDWTKTTKVELGIQGNLSKLNLPALSNNNTDPNVSPQQVFSQVMQTTPILYPTMYPGNLVPGINTANAQKSPYEMLTQMGFVNTFNNQLYTNLRVTQDLNMITKGLSVYGLYSYDIFNVQRIIRSRQRNTWRIDPVTPYNPDGTVKLLPVITSGTENLGYGNNNGGNRQNYFEAAINYNRRFGKDHSVTGLLLYNQRENINASAGDVIASLPSRLQGYVGRVTYGWREKYFVEGNFGYNGSENFAPENRFGFFPSVGLGWVVSNEKFFDPLSRAIQFLKLRYSDGNVGSASGGRRFGFLTVVSDNGTTAPGFTFGNNTSADVNRGYGGVRVTDYGYPIGWSTSHKQNLGVEFKTFNSRLSVIVDFFKEHRTDVLIQRGSLPAYVGLNNVPFASVGVIDNAGVDGTIEGGTFKLGAFNLDLRATFTYNRDKLIENDAPKQPYAYMERRGYNVLSNYGYVAEGLFQSQREIDNHADQSPLGGRPRPGDIKYKDLNADGLIDNLDIRRIGNGDVPNLVWGGGFNLSYKSFYFGAFFQGISGAQRQLSGDGIIPFSNSTGAERSNLFTIAQDRWTEANPNPNAFYPRLAYGNGPNRNNSVASTWWIKDVDFIRLKTVDLGVNLPATWVKKAGFRNAKFYAQGMNLFYWSSFKLWDPELNTGNGSAYPNTRNITIGLQASL